MTEKAYWLPQRMVLWRGQMADELGVLSITQQQAADALGVSRRTYIGWETGESPINRRVAFACNFIRQNIAALVPTLEAETDREKSVEQKLAVLSNVETVQRFDGESPFSPAQFLVEDVATAGEDDAVALETEVQA